MKTFLKCVENPTAKCWSLGPKNWVKTFVKRCRKWRRFTCARRYRRPEIPLFHTLMVWIFGGPRSWSAGINEKQKKDLSRSCASFGWSLLEVNDRNWNLWKWHWDFRSSLHQKPWKCLDDHWSQNTLCSGLKPAKHVRFLRSKLLCRRVPHQCSIIRLLGGFKSNGLKPPTSKRWEWEEESLPGHEFFHRFLLLVL